MEYREKIVKEAKKKTDLKENFIEQVKETSTINIEPIPEGKVSEILTFSNGNDSITIETVASFRNFFNYLNTPTTKLRVLDNEIYEYITINYRLEDSPAFELIKSQTIKIIIDNKQVSDVTLDSLVEFFSRNPQSFKQIIEKINTNSQGRGKGLLEVKQSIHTL
ncbi:hypothetical protein [Caviibacter abscessus]|uniref:hypothetical protein n=1 Tax=Caviibacter abscessus TaxID=1766719 RepID=UPI00083812CC|nr:hypothetical protein [Caviibacter abscessus]